MSDRKKFLSAIQGCRDCVDFQLRSTGRADHLGDRGCRGRSEESSTDLERGSSRGGQRGAWSDGWAGYQAMQLEVAKLEQEPEYLAKVSAFFAANRP